MPPYFIVVPLADLELFQKEYDNLKERNEINTLPKFLTEQEQFDPKILFEGTTLKIFAWKMSEEMLNQAKKRYDTMVYRLYRT